MNEITTEEILRTIWIQPKQTFERILDKSTSTNVLRSSIPFIAISGAGFALSRASSRSAGDTIESLPLLITYVSIIGVIFGFVGLYFWSWILERSNQWFKGTGDFTDIAKALSWATYPFAAITLLWIPKLLLFGMDNFTDEMPKLAGSSVLRVSYFAILAVEIPAFIYASFIWLVGLGVACGFSTWKALGVWILSYLMVFVPLVVLAYFILLT